MKKYFMGLFTGLIIMLIIPTYAAIEEYILYKADYDIVVNGSIYSDEKLPALNYKGYTYVPLRNIGNILGTDVKWNAELFRAEIGGDSKVKETTEESKTIDTLSTKSIQTPAQNQVTQYEADGLTIFNIENKEYVAVRNLSHKLSDMCRDYRDKTNTIIWYQIKSTLQDTYSLVKSTDRTINETILENIPINKVQIDDKTYYECIEYEYFKTNISPVVEEAYK